MKKIFLITLTFFLFLACDQVYVKTPQPAKGTKIKSFIDDLQGVYSDSLIKVSIEEKRIFIDDTPYELTKKDPGENEVQVRFYKDFYFANFRDSNYYSLFAGKFYENKLAVYMLNASELSVDKMKKILEVVQLAEEGEYIIDPSASEFDALFNGGFFDVATILTREQK